MNQPHAKHIVITGASRGLGRATTDAMIAAGHRVSACARNAESMKELQQTYGNQHFFAALDLSSPSAIETWCNQVLAHAGAPQLLLNNAGVINTNAALWDVEPAEFQSVVDVNISAVFHTIRGFIPGMIAVGEGVVVNFSSGWGRSVSPEVAPYCASKWAIEGMTQALAAELPKGIAAVALNPGVINTDMLQSCFGDAADSYGDAAQWAKKAVPYLLSLDASHNGQSLTAPG